MGNDLACVGATLVVRILKTIIILIITPCLNDMSLNVDMTETVTVKATSNWPFPSLKWSMLAPVYALPCFLICLPIPINSPRKNHLV